MKNTYLMALVAIGISSTAAAQAPTPSEVGQRLIEADLVHTLRMADQRRALEAAELEARLAEANAKRLDGEKRVAEAVRDKDRAARGEDTGPNARRIDSSMMGMPPPPSFGGVGFGASGTTAMGAAPTPIPEQAPAPRKVAPVEPAAPKVKAVVGKKAFFETADGPVTAGVGESVGEHRVVAVSANDVKVAWRDKTRVLQVPAK